MPDCKFCGGTIDAADSFCKKCGYDPKTDKINPNFVVAAKDVGKTMGTDSINISRRGVSPAVKKFALIGLAILVFSIFYKNHFSISNVIAEVRHTFTMISKGKFRIWGMRNKQAEWIDVRTFQDRRK